MKNFVSKVNDGTQESYTPYSCRCEAFSRNRVRGGRFNTLNGNWELVNSLISVPCDKCLFMIDKKWNLKRRFEVSPSWREMKVYVLVEKFECDFDLYLNEEYIGTYRKDEIMDFDISERLLFNGVNNLVFYPRDIYGKTLTMGLGSVVLLARPEEHISALDIKVEKKDENLCFSVNPAFSGGKNEFELEVYDESYAAKGACKATEKAELTVPFDGKSKNFTILVISGGEYIPVEYTFEEEPAFNLNDIGLKLLPGKILEIKNNSENELPGGLFIQYRLWCGDGKGTISQNCVELGKIEGNTATAAVLKYDTPDISPFEYYLDFSLWYQGKFSERQIKLPVLQTECENFYSCDMDNVFVHGEDELCISDIGGCVYFFDTKKGNITTLGKDNMLMVSDSQIMLDLGNDEKEFLKCREFGIVSRTEKYVLMKGIYEAQGKEYYIMWVVYGNGELGVSMGSLDGDCEHIPTLLFKFAEAFSKTYSMGERNGRCDMNSSEFDKFSEEKSRIVFVKDRYGRGLLLKSMPYCQVKTFVGHYMEIGAEKEIFKENGGNYSFILRPVFEEEGDIIREARTLPVIG